MSFKLNYTKEINLRTIFGDFLYVFGGYCITEEDEGYNNELYRSGIWISIFLLIEELIIGCFSIFLVWNYFNKPFLSFQIEFKRSILGKVSKLVTV